MYIQDDRKSPVSNGLSYDLFEFFDKCTLNGYKIPPWHRHNYKA